MTDDDLRATIARLRELEFWCKYHRGTYTQIDVPDMTALLDAAERAQAMEAALRLAWPHLDPFDMPMSVVETIKRALKEPTA